MKILLLVLLLCINSKAIESCEYSIMTLTSRNGGSFSVVVDPIHGDYTFDNLFKFVSTNNYELSKNIPGTLSFTEIDPLGYVKVGDIYGYQNFGYDGILYEYGISRISTNNLEISAGCYSSLGCTRYFDFTSITNLNGNTDFGSTTRNNSNRMFYDGNSGYIWYKSNSYQFYYGFPTVTGFTSYTQIPRYCVNPMLPLYMTKVSTSATKSNIWISVSNKIIE